jgi:hypothetical protein
MRAILKTINFVTICLIVREATELPYYYFFITKQSIQCFATEQKRRDKKFADFRIFFSFLYSSFAKFF